MNYAITLRMTDSEEIESRLQPILGYYLNWGPNKEFLLLDIDATGEVGNSLTQQMNEQKNGFSITAANLAALISDNGQIFEFDLLVRSAHEVRIFVRDGNIIDLVGDKEAIPLAVVGEYEELDIRLFKTEHNGSR